MKKNFFLNYKVIMGLLVIVLAAASCKKLIEIPGNPPTKITQEQQFADSTVTMMAVAGVYSYPSLGGFTFNNGFLTIATGLSADEFSTTSTNQNIADFYSYSQTDINTTVAILWADPYKGIYPVNTIMEQVGSSSKLSATFKKQIVAEMKVLRALYHFNLVNLFGGVPVITSTDYKVNAVLPRNSVDEVYAQIIKDLTEAKQDLALNYPSAGRLRPNRYTAEAFLAKVYLYRKNWQAAYDAANSVITSGVYTLPTDLNAVFLDGSKEAIWQLPAHFDSRYLRVKDTDNFIPFFNGLMPTYPLSTYLKNAFEPGDSRMIKWLGISTVGGQNYYYPYKYKNTAQVPASTVEDYMIFRFAEQYLIRAEARIHLGDIAGGIDDLNVLRTRARAAATTAIPNPLPDLSNTLSEADALKALMKERQTELFCEWGNRWFDLKRTGTADAILGAEKPGWKPGAVLYPVPLAEREKNPFLTPN
ncbi:RagB/SusD family nutrient uptake outer membrane protein [Pedobacter nyackensis]|uniref:RagB/SusD family nutrient uptake outer membrane protein n=1 Tax=Pedobacter nyackensis TaxID=475255 RepID=UPI00292E624E|nr:RagB/SusD family nutrient uptake outer membrane protein [Pedobacter nyackensis]